MTIEASEELLHDELLETYLAKIAKQDGKVATT